MFCVLVHFSLTTINTISLGHSKKQKPKQKERNEWIKIRYLRSSLIFSIRFKRVMTEQSLSNRKIKDVKSEIDKTTI